MDIGQAVHTLMTAAGQEAENVTRRTLKSDLILSVADDPTMPSVRFGVGEHDWRMAYYQEPNEEPELLPIAEAARRFSSRVMNHPIPENNLLYKPPTPGREIQPLPSITQKGLPSRER